MESELVWLLCLRIAEAAPAMACGDSLPVTLDSCLPLGCGNRLTRLLVAKELAGRVCFDKGLVPREVGSLDMGCMDARRFVEFEERAAIEVLEASNRGREADDAEWAVACCE